MSVNFVCNVIQAGPGVNGSLTPDPQVQFLLTDAQGTFSNTWFFASQAAKNQMLAVALAAISTQSQVNAWVDAPEEGTVTQCYALYIKPA
jgi:hypothetical protein